MTARTDLWLFLAGVVASSVNAAAGGGTLLSFPSLLAAGLSPLAANATSTIGLLTGYFASLAGYRAALRALREDAVRSIVPSILGGIVGAFLLLQLGGAVFARVVPALLLGSAALLLLNPLLMRALARRKSRGPASATSVFVANFVISVYAGYFGAGVGILFLAVMGLLLRRELAEVNALKVVVSLIANVVAAVTMVLMQLAHPSGAIVYRAAAPLAVGALLGGFLGVTVVQRLPPAALRAFAALVGVAIAVYLVAR